MRVVRSRTCRQRPQSLLVILLSMASLWDHAMSRWMHQSHWNSTCTPWSICLPAIVQSTIWNQGQPRSFWASWALPEVVGMAREVLLEGELLTAWTEHFVLTSTSHLSNSFCARK